ncbi:MAG: sensor histidine kinase [Streptomycetaceae bacterium]|nr:sensor histidine kinase [Streptomycetaceae bacterium]
MSDATRVRRMPVAWGDDTPGEFLTQLPDEDGPWRQQVMTAWHFAFAVVIAVVALSLADNDAPAVAYVVLAVYAAAYALVMVPAMRRPDGRRVYVFLAVSAAAATAIAFLAPVGLLILYCVFPHVFAVLNRVAAKFAGVLAIAALAAVGIVVHDGTDAGSVVDAIVTVLVALLISIGLGFVTSVLIRESERRGRLIAELERTRAELAEAHHEAGVLAERQRMAREIHDTLAQGFTSVLMLVQAADASLDSDPEGTRRRLDLAARTARENLAEARALVAAQDPVELAGASLPDALGRVVAGLAEELDIAAEFRVVGDPRDLPAATQVVVVRAVQECLANVRKHAGATAVDAELTYRETGVRLMVRDDGCGFDTAVADCVNGGNGSGGYGLRGMRARIEQARGTLEITSAPGAGTTVRVEVP